ncbi:MAG TPA: MaoC family dehydratase [Steroidobacter sp.]|uniref:MaoC family dehydratase n=1 Tax=Steroidobacter sp. TaxID=1978227 RepID=UPI002ED8CAA8
MAIEPVSLEQYRQFVGRQIGVSGWYLMDQQRIDRFAAVTEDERFIHVDPLAAATTPFGGTIAHGFLSLSMLSAMAASVIPPVVGAEMMINYGLNSVRFLQPVGVGKHVRGIFTLKDLQERSPAQWQSILTATVEIEGEHKPALVAEWLTLTILPRPNLAG